MKIIAVGRNYAEHAAELGNETPDEPVIFLKPDTALLRNNDPFYFPSFSNNIHYEVEVVLQIGKAGKHIGKSFALSYVSAVTVGIDFTARDLQQQLKEKGLPWELAKGFDSSAPVGNLRPITSFEQLREIEFALTLNDKTVQRGNTRDMLFNFEEIISFVSSRITLKKGDLIFTGTPPGVGKIAIGDRLNGFLGGDLALECAIK